MDPNANPQPAPEAAPDAALPQAMTALAQAMAALMAQLNAAPQNAAPGQAQDPAPAPAHRARIKARDPDTYDGSDPSKLRAFLSQCKLVFRARPHDFADDQVKITYAVSWLKGTAQRWYEPTLELHEDDLPDFAIFWDDFEEAMKTTFGEPDPISAASYKLDHLAMKDSHHVTKYNVDFNKLATLTGFDERALYAMYYRGLAPRIKDSLAISGKPDTLDELRTKAQSLDLRYWERKDEDRYKLNSTGGQFSKSSSTASTSTSQTTNRASTPSTSRSRASTPAASSSKPKTPDLSKVLGPDGKLLPAEKERRKKNNLCLICAAKDHHAEQCPSRRERAQARAATIKELDSASEPEGSDSPN